MGKEDPVTEEQCSERNSKVWDRLDLLSDKVNKIIGGILVTTFVVGAACYYINYRFGVVDKKVEEIHKYLIPKSK